jgi:hypothetical protein
MIHNRDSRTPGYSSSLRRDSANLLPTVRSIETIPATCCNDLGPRNFPPTRYTRFGAPKRLADFRLVESDPQNASAMFVGAIWSPKTSPAISSDRFVAPDAFRQLPVGGFAFTFAGQPVPMAVGRKAKDKLTNCRPQALQPVSLQSVLFGVEEGRVRDRRCSGFGGETKSGPLV